jgi:hypothetical protein
MRRWIQQSERTTPIRCSHWPWLRKSTFVSGDVSSTWRRRSVNANPVLTYNEAFSTTANTWLRPNSVLQPRLVKFSAQFNF